MHLGLDLVPYLVTFFTGIFVNVQTGLVVGTLLHIVILIYKSSNVSIVVNDRRFIPDRSLYFPALDKLQKKLNKVESDNGVVVDLVNVSDADYTIVKGFGQIADELDKRGSSLLLYRANDKMKSAIAGVGNQNIKIVDNID